ncbi:MAG: 2'-5' RNA ligase family protein [Candidatus Saccharimonadales bacterium]
MAQDHFKRHNHYDGVVDWNFNVVYANQPSVRAMADAYAPIITRPELYDPIPTEWLHATILRVGRLEDYTETEMLAVAAKVQDAVADLSLPEFHFGDQVMIYGNVCFRVEPGSELQKLYDIVAESLEDVVGPERATKTPYQHFIAHTSLAYTKAQNNEADIEARLSAANVESAKFKIVNMPLIKQRPVNGHYEWEIVKDIALS